MCKIAHAAASIPVLEDPSSRMTKDGTPFDTQMEKAWRANSSKRSDFISRKSTNHIIWSHAHSSLVTPKESRNFPVSFREAPLVQSCRATSISPKMRRWLTGSVRMLDSTF